MKISHLSLAFGSKIIYDDTGFLLETGDKAGLVGVNGAGKTTLMKILLSEYSRTHAASPSSPITAPEIPAASLITPDSAEITLPSTRLAYLPQEIATTKEDQDKTVWDYIKDGRPVDALQDQLNAEYEKLAKYPDSAKITARITALQDLIDSYNLATYDYDLLKITEKMHLDSLLDRKMRDLSGGQKSKVAFAKVLFENAGLMLLDEPTNHLDTKTRSFVENYLKNYPGTVLIISHDQTFLDTVTNKTLFLNKSTHKIKLYHGNYSTFRRLYAEEKAAEDQKITKEEREIKRIEEFVERARAAKRSNTALIRQGHVREKMLEKKLATLGTREAEYQKVSLDLTPRELSSKTPLEVQNLTFAYSDSDHNLYQKLNFSLSRGEKFLIVGENGVGKSTLLKLIVGNLQPLEGSIIFGHHVDLAYYAQELEILDDRLTILENLKSYNYTDTELRSLLSNFLFTGDEVFKKVSVLSPGEKARVAMAKILSGKPNFIILDEPTNHLDPDTQKIIGENFRDFPGTLMVVSHNPSFVEQVGITRMLIIPSNNPSSSDSSVKSAQQNTQSLTLIKNYSRELLDYYYYLNSDLV